MLNLTVIVCSFLQGSGEGEGWCLEVKSTGLFNYAAFVKVLSVTSLWRKGPGCSAAPQSNNDLLVSHQKDARAGPGSLTPDL